MSWAVKYREGNPNTKEASERLNNLSARLRGVRQIATFLRTSETDSSLTLGGWAVIKGSLYPITYDTKPNPYYTMYLHLGPEEWVSLFVNGVGDLISIDKGNEITITYYNNTECLDAVHTVDLNCDYRLPDLEAASWLLVNFDSQDIKLMVEELSNYYTQAKLGLPQPLDLS